MKVEDTKFPELKIIHSFVAVDGRGKFVKVFNDVFFSDNKFKFNIAESYYSISKKGVIRGMHFQLPPMDHFKLVTVLEGEIIDVCVDLRKDSPTKGKVFHIILDGKSNKSLLIPSGFAHGFETLSDRAIVNYYQTTVYSKQHDFGILWNTIPYQWKTESPLLSERDKTFISMDKFIDSKSNTF